MAASLEAAVRTIVDAQAPAAPRAARDAAAALLEQVGCGGWKRLVARATAGWAAGGPPLSRPPPQLKTGDPRAAASAGAALATPGHPPEVAHFGYAVLTHLAGARWDEFGEGDRSALADLAFALVAPPRGAAPPQPFAVRSKAALLLALVVKRRGGAGWAALAPRLLELGAAPAPAAAEAAASVLTAIAEEVVAFPGDDTGAAERRDALAALAGSLPAVLSFLRASLDAHAPAALAGDAGAGSACRAALAAALALAEWAPLGALATAGVLSAAGALLTCADADLRLCAADVLRGVVGRKQAQEDPGEYGAAMAAAGGALVGAASALLASPTAAAALDYDGDLDEYGLRLADALASFGGAHLGKLPAEEARRACVGALLALSRHPYLPLAGRAVAVWPHLLASAGGGGGGGGGGGASTPSPTPSRHHALPPDAVSALVDLAADGLRAAAAAAAADEATAAVPPYYDSFADWRAAVLDHRTALARVARGCAALAPGPALEAAGRRVAGALAAVAAASAASTPSPALDAAEASLDAAICFADAVVAAAAGGGARDRAVCASPAPPPSPPPAALDGMHALLTMLLAAPPGRPATLALIARGLEAVAPIAGPRPDAAAAIAGRVFDLLDACPLEGDAGGAPPDRPTVAWKELLAARGRVAAVLLALARAAPQSLAPHLEALAARVQVALDGGRLWPAEHAAAADALLLAASGAGAGATAGAALLEWALAPVRAAWTSPEFEAAVAGPEAFVERHAPVSTSPDGAPCVGGGRARWALYHQVHLLERLARRACPAPAPAGAPPAVAAAAAAAAAADPLWAAFAAHLTWALLPCLRTLWCLHGVWAPGVRARLGGAGRALDVGPKERALYLKRATRAPAARAASSSSPSSAPLAEDDGATLAGPGVGSLRAWLRQARECVVQTLGALASTPPALYSVPVPGAPAAWAAALTDGLGHVDPSAVRLLERHVVVPLVRGCPPSHRPAWLAPVLVPLLPAAHAALAAGWAAVGGGGGGGSGAGDDDDVVAERLLRECTQEHAALLRALLDRPVLPVAAGAPAVATPAAPPATAESAFDFLLAAAPDAALAAVVTAATMLWWPDHEAAARGAAVCRAAVPLAARDARLRDLVGRQMLQGALAALANPAASSAQAEALHLARDVLLQELAAGSPAPREVMLALPGMAPARLDAFAAKLATLRSDREQRAALKKLLAATGGDALAAALSDWRPAAAAGAAAGAAAAAAGARSGRGARAARAPRQDEGGGFIGLAS